MNTDVRSTLPAPCSLRASLATAPLLVLLMGCGATHDELDDEELRMIMMGSTGTYEGGEGDTTWGSTTWGGTSTGGSSTSTSTGYGSTSTGSTSTSTGYGSTSDGSTGGAWEPDLGGSGDTGPFCVPLCELEEPEECCLPACASGAPQPVPGDPTNFNCPVADMPYNCGLDGTDLFDCDDFAYACEMWGRNNGYNICQFYFSFELPDGSSSAHQINIVEFEYATPGLAKYCLIEPQSNTSYACWIQEDGAPVPPGWATQQACTAVGGTQCNSTDVQCDAAPNPNAGEVCFNTLPAVCSMFRSQTGLCPYTFEPDHDCSGTRAGGDPCYWSCDDDEVCGAACDQCDPAPGTTGDEVEYCAGVEEGELTNCFWECTGGQSCGEACYQCI